MIVRPTLASAVLYAHQSMNPAPGLLLGPMISSTSAISTSGASSLICLVARSMMMVF
jgi:hypothetical protein